MFIGICIGDNDFQTTIRAFLFLFNGDAAIIWRYPENATKANIVKVWNLTAAGIYQIAQNGFGYVHRGQTQTEHIAHTAKYLTLQERQVYLGDECLERITQDNNGEFSCIDTDTGEVFTS